MRLNATRLFRFQNRRSAAEGLCSRGNFDHQLYGDIRRLASITDFS